MKPAHTNPFDGHCRVSPSPELWDEIVSVIEELAGELATLTGPQFSALIADRLGLPVSQTVEPELNSIAFYAPSGSSEDGAGAGGDGTVMAAPAMDDEPSPAPSPRPPATGTRRAVVILVDFPEAPHTTDPDHYRSLLFGGSYPPVQGLPTTMRDYYLYSSASQLAVEGEVYGWYTMPNPESYYANGKSGLDGSSPNGKTLAAAAIDAAVADGVDFSGFDTDNDGYLDGLIIVKAGTGAETITGNKTRRQNTIWSHKWQLTKARKLNGKTAFAYTMQPEDGKLGVFCHEFGHFLGLPDLYDTTNRSRGVGHWCVMGSGSWGGGGDNPVNMSAWCRTQLGWIAPLTGTNASYGLKPSHTSGDILRLKLAAPARPAEYFLLEYRQQSDIDAAVPGDGLLIWRIDEDAPNNDDPTHYKVVPVQADANKELEGNRNNGDAGDVYPGSSNNTTFDDSSSPSAGSWEGTPSNVAVTNIAINTSPATASCDVSGP